jgi:hypothetical protein
VVVEVMITSTMNGKEGMVLMVYYEMDGLM